MIANTTDCVNSTTKHFDYDYGLHDDLSIDRECWFRIGWLLEAMSAVKVANKAKSVAKFLEMIQRRYDACREARWKASQLADRQAKKRLKRNEYRLKFTEDECCRARFCRGAMQSSATAEHGIRELVKSGQITGIEAVRNVLAIWEEACWEWALCAGHDANSPGICAPFICEALETKGGAE